MKPTDATQTALNRIKYGMYPMIWEAIEDAPQLTRLPIHDVAAAATAVAQACIALWLDATPD